MELSGSVDGRPHFHTHPSHSVTPHLGGVGATFLLSHSSHRHRLAIWRHYSPLLGCVARFHTCWWSFVRHLLWEGGLYVLIVVLVVGLIKLLNVNVGAAKRIKKKSIVVQGLLARSALPSVTFCYLPSLFFLFGSPFSFFYRSPDKEMHVFNQKQVYEKQDPPKAETLNKNSQIFLE